MTVSTGSCSRIVLAAVLSTALVACQNNPVRDVTSVFEAAPTEPTPGQTPEQFRLAQLTKESEEIRGQALLAGLGVGVVLALTICDSPISVCGVAATAGGAAIGYGAGMYVAQKSQLAKEEQDQISGSISSAEAALNTYKERADVAQEVVAQNRAAVQAMNDTAAASDSERAYRVQQYKNMEGDRDRIEALQSQLENDLRFMNLELEGREKSGDTNLAELKQQRDALQQVNQQLTSQLNAMNGLIEDVPDEIRSAAA